MENLVLITCPKCGYMINGRLWRCPECGGDDNHKSEKSRKSHQDSKNIIAAMSALIGKIF